MSEERQELLFDLLTKKAIYGLDEAEQKQLDQINPGNADAEFQSLEMTAAAISLVDFSDIEPMPEHLFAKIAANAEKLVGEDAPWPPVYKTAEDERPSRGWFGWLGWTAALAACIALAVNIYITNFNPPSVAVVPTQIETPKVKTPGEMREDMLRTTAGLIKANWAAGNVKELKEISGDVVWSDEKQTGYMRFKGLPANDKAKETYQLWIFGKTQDKATPIDGGTFDVAANGEVIIPIDAKLKAVEPGMFAITVEKPGGVVVSKREKIAALATVETKTS
ncbi:MAG: anti-sigma factor [Pyrinomonadaceae bacterium]